MQINLSEFQKYREVSVLATSPFFSPLSPELPEALALPYSLSNTAAFFYFTSRLQLAP